MAYQPNELLSRLIGEQLGIVTFARDYLVLNFDGPLLTCEVWPRVQAEDQTYYMGQQLYRDALCSLIGKTVTNTIEQTGIGLVIEFGNDQISLHPALDEFEGPEIAMLNGFPDQEWMVWRPGEDSFEDLV